jgi:hypothetical protein
VHGSETVRRAYALADEGLKQADIARELGIGQTTVSRWLRRGPDKTLGSPMRVKAAAACPGDCPFIAAAPPREYAYLLGQYLGDGSIVHTRRGVYRLFVTCCAAYPGIVEECERAIQAVLPNNRVGRRAKRGAIDVNSYSKHWPCLLPQHGPGRKHSRAIVLAPWQATIALDAHPGPFIRGLVHSDGCRSLNKVRNANGRQYAYVRYQFSNRSSDIRGLFTEACDRLGVEWRQMNRYDVSVARRDSVATLEGIVGPKT